jgi:F-type H+-transporting ATPase subunit b
MSSGRSSRTRPGRRGEYPKEAERQIQRETAKAIEQIRGEAVDLSVAIASKLIRREIKPTDQDALLNEALREMGRPPQ